MGLPPGLGGHSGILNLNFRDKNVLHASYMPFFKNGGLFIPTSRPYKMDEEVFMLLILLDEPDKIPVAGRVAWITPKAAQGNRAPGIGVHFSDKNTEVRGIIETYLAGSLNSSKTTHTF